MSTVERNVYCASYSLPYSGNESLVNAMHKSKNLMSKLKAEPSLLAKVKDML